MSRILHDPVTCRGPVVGIDIGKRRDPTAVCVAEIEARPANRGGTEAHYLVRFVQRLPLETPYPEIARRLEILCDRAATAAGRVPEIFVDATGVGTPVVDLLQATRSLERLWAVTFTGGSRRTVRAGERRITVGKEYLVQRLQALLGSRRIHLPQRPEAQALARELLDYEMRVGENARARFGAFRSGTHDDLVTALALAVQPPIGAIR